MQAPPNVKKVGTKVIANDTCIWNSLKGILGIICKVDSNCYLVEFPDKTVVTGSIKLHCIPSELDEVTPQGAAIAIPAGQPAFPPINQPQTIAQLTQLWKQEQDNYKPVVNKVMTPKCECGLGHNRLSKQHYQWCRCYKE